MVGHRATQVGGGALRPVGQHCESGAHQRQIVRDPHARKMLEQERTLRWPNVYVANDRASVTPFVGATGLAAEDSLNEVDGTGVPPEDPVEELHPVLRILVSVSMSDVETCSRSTAHAHRNLKRPLESTSVAAPGGQPVHERLSLLAFVARLRRYPGGPPIKPRSPSCGPKTLKDGRDRVGQCHHWVDQAAPESSEGPGVDPSASE